MRFLVFFAPVLCRLVTESSRKNRGFDRRPLNVFQVKERVGVIEGFRGIAVLQVTYFHVWLFGGIPAQGTWPAVIAQDVFSGLYMFFFVSGFVIVYPFVYAQHYGEPYPAWRHFAWRRFIKIMPSYWLCIAVAYAVGFAAVESRHATVLQDLVTHALFIHTWWPNTATSINGPLWTLGVEVPFYAVFPLIWWCFKRQPWLTGCALIAVAMAYRSLHGPHLPSGNLPSYIDLFAFGMLTAWCCVHFADRMRSGRTRYLAPVMATAGLAILALGSIAFVKESLGLPLPFADVREFLGIGFGLLAFGALCSRPWAIALSNPLMRFLAITSYNTYLWNWMIIHYMRHLPLSSLAFTVLSLAVSIAVGIILTYVVERPLLRLPDPQIRLQTAEAASA